MDRPCKMEVKRADMDKHRQGSCTAMCEHEGCGMSVLPRLMAMHLQSCAFRPVTCVCGEVWQCRHVYTKGCLPTRMSRHIS
jgi:hypothetical protein